MFLLEYRSKWHRILVHVIFWIVYVTFFSALTWVNDRQPFFVLWLRAWMFLPIDITATYITLYFLIPRFVLQRKYLVFSLLFLILGFMVIFLNQAVSYYIYIPTFLPDWPRKGFFYFSFWYNLVSTYAVVIFAAGIKIAKMWLSEQKAKAQLEANHAKSEIALLKYQLNPHFIFNTLNNIDTLIHKDPDKASRCIMKLSEIMRYVAYESEEEKVPLAKEVEYLRSFIELQQLRFGRDLISFEVEIRNPARTIAPMLFIPLVENAIKHGDRQNGSPSVRVKLFADYSIDFVVENTVPSQPAAKDKVGGIGLKNLKRRLELIYPGNYSFDLDITGNRYIAHLWIR
ncbi:MAG TPA: histidine kinase [Bacteroidales bacterium]|nr:histidine kinase [Bacteroidales bacterium]HRZ49760.1 histidine kinase [Bacteroidales bacterium]